MLALYLAALETDEEKTVFEKLYESCKRSALSVAMRYLTNQDLAENAVSDAFLSLIENKAKVLGLPEENMKSLLFTLVKNKAIDIWRKETTRQHDILDERYDSIDNGEMALSEYVENLDSFERLRRHVSALPEKYKVTLELRYFHDMSEVEIAKMLGINLNTVYTHMSRAKKMLLNSLKREGEL